MKAAKGSAILIIPNPDQANGKAALAPGLERPFGTVKVAGRKNGGNPMLVIGNNALKRGWMYEYRITPSGAVHAHPTKEVR